MATYKVKGGQNLFDVALHLYGTVEGLFDILISNPDINMTTDLVAGQELEYHTEFIINQGIVDKFAEDDMQVVNGERHVYHKPITEPLVAIIKVPEDQDIVEFSVSGEGTMFVDWGDNSNIEEITLTHTQTLFSHYLDNVVDVRRVRIYGNFKLQQLGLTRLKGDMYITRPITVDEFVCQSNDNELKGLFLFEGTYMVDLQGMSVSDLSSIADMSLSELNLMGVRFEKPEVLNDYLVYIRQNHQNRRACKVYLDTEPNEDGMQAIQDIISEVEWNTPEKWEFHINDKLYTYIEPETDGKNTD